jgi:hypothetical protein
MTTATKSQALTHILYSSVLVFSLVHFLITRMLGPQHELVLLYIIIALTIVAAGSTRLLRPPHVLSVLFVGLALVCFRNIHESSAAAYSAFAFALPVALLASVVKIDPRLLVRSLYGWGLATLAVCAFFGQFDSARLNLAGENPIWVARMALLGAIAAFLWKPGSRVVRSVAIIGLLMIIWFSGSRGPMLVAVVGFLTYGALTSIGVRRALAVLSGILAMFLGVLFESNLAAYRNNATSVMSFDWRTETWLKAIHLWGASIGAGFGLPLNDPTVGLSTYPHNFLLEVGVQGGLVAVMIVCLIFYLSWRRCNDAAMRTLLVSIGGLSLVSGSIWSSYELWLILGACLSASPGLAAEAAVGTLRRGNPGLGTRHG